MINLLQTQHNYSPAEYLEFEVQAQERHEYIDGEIIPMTGGTPNHNRIVGNFYAALNFALKGQPYDVFVTDQRLWMPRRRIYTYPDIMGIQGELQFQAERRDTLMNPLTIVEVLSESTRSYDKDEKFRAYRTLSPFQEYVLIDQYSVYVERYAKTGSRQWSFCDYEGLDTTLSLSSLPFEIVVGDLYDKVQFEDNNAVRASRSTLQ